MHNSKYSSLDKIHLNIIYNLNIHKTKYNNLFLFFKATIFDLDIFISYIYINKLFVNISINDGHRVYVHINSPEPEHELFLVYGKGRPGVIRGMDIKPKVQDEYMIPIENLMNPRALDFHAQSSFIYFADATSYLIGRQKIDGTERDIILKEGSEVFSFL